MNLQFQYDTAKKQVDSSEELNNQLTSKLSISEDKIEK